MRKLFLLFIFISFNLFSTELDFNICLDKIEVPDFQGLHSFAYAKHENYIILIGGRKDGLHARKPFNTFPSDLRNNEVIIINTNDFSVIKRSIDFNNDITEQLLSTNMNFTQVEDDLYITGGFGYSTAINDHVTFSNLIKVDVQKLLNSILNKTEIESSFNYIKNDIFAVTGGNLAYMNNTFYLVGGQKFNGRYNPMGNGTYVQEYTNQVRSFKVKDDNNILEITDINAITDPVNLRRRDYNLVAQIDNGELYHTIFSGVFQLNADLPFLYPVEIFVNKIEAKQEFSQLLSNYHTGHLPIYNSKTNEMFTIFFGGISQYYKNENDELINDENVPFVKTISCVKRNSNGNYEELVLTIKMENYKGAFGEFIFKTDLELIKDEVYDYSKLNYNDTLSLGYIIGGINSNSMNPFSSNNTSSTNADNSIYKVNIIKSKSLEVKSIKNNELIDFTITPNPVNNTIHFVLKSNITINSVSYIITNTLGEVIENKKIIGIDYSINSNSYPKNQVLFITLIINDKYYKTQKFIKS